MAWSAEAEFERCVAQGMYEQLDAEELLMGGTEVSSVVNNPRRRAMTDGWNALAMVTSSLGGTAVPERGDSAATTTASQPAYDFSDYLRQVSHGPGKQNGMQPDHHAPGQDGSLPIQVARAGVRRLFFRPDFDIANSQILTQACAFDKDNDDETVGDLTRQLDVIDSCIEREVSNRSEEYLHCAVTLHSFHRSVKAASASASSSMGAMRGLRSSVGQHVADLTLLQRRRSNLANLQQTLAHVTAARQVLATLRTLLEIQEWLPAADAVQEARRACAMDVVPHVAALASLPSDVDACEQELRDGIVASVRQAAALKAAPDIEAALAHQLQLRCSGEAASSLEAPFLGESETLATFFTRRSGGGGAAADGAAAQGVGLPPDAHDASGALPQVWEVHRSALCPPLLAALRCGNDDLLDDAFSELEAGMLACVKTDLSSLLKTFVHVLASADDGGRAGRDRHGPGNGMRGSMEEQLQRLRPSAFLGLLQALLLWMHVVTWFTQGTRKLIVAALRSAQAPAQLLDNAYARCEAARSGALDAIQGRWSKLLVAAFARDLEAYARGPPARTPSGPPAAMMGAHGPPLTPAGFQSITRLAQRVEAACIAAGCRPDALRVTLRGLGKNLLLGFARQKQSELQTVMDADTWASAAVPAGSQRFVDELCRRSASSADPSNAATKNSHAANPDTNGHAIRESAPSGLEKERSVGDIMASPERSGTNGAGASHRGTQGGADQVANSPEIGFTGRINTGRAASTSGGGLQSSGGTGSHRLRTLNSEFFAVNSLVLLLQQVESLVNFTGPESSLHYDVVIALIDLLKFFNSRSCQLILGAGAIQTARLRSITARHMAACSQSLLAIEALLPVLRERLLATVHSPQQHAPVAGLFDTLLEDIVHHRRQIHAKLVNIMRERLAKSLKAFYSVGTAWGAASEADANTSYGASTLLQASRSVASGILQVDTGPPLPSGSLNGEASAHSRNGAATSASGAHAATATYAPLIQQIVQQLQTLLNVLEGVMSAEQLRDIFERVRRMYSDSLARAFRSLEPSGADWLPRACHDISVLLQALRSLPADADETSLAPLESLHQRLLEIHRSETHSTHNDVAPEVPRDDDEGSHSEVSELPVSSFRQESGQISTGALEGAADATIPAPEADETQVEEVHASGALDASQAGVRDVKQDRHGDAGLQQE